jgi:hypothetical protein
MLETVIVIVVSILLLPEYSPTVSGAFGSAGFESSSLLQAANTSMNAKSKSEISLLFFIIIFS